MNISLLAIFMEGLLSFLSPCVLPLLPLYMSYLAGDNKEKDDQGNIRYNTLKVFFTTLFFVMGIGFTFVLLSLSVSYIKTFIDDYAETISIIGGTLLILFGLHEMDIISISLLNEEYKLKVNLHLNRMNYLKAFALGFVFSLGWSPCIGPLLANAILMATTDSFGYLYLVAYGLGLTVPFLITGLLTSTVLSLLEKYKNVLRWVLKVAGIILILFGLSMIDGAIKDIRMLKNNEESLNAESNSPSIMELELKDHLGNTVKLSDYKGEYIFINFSATWCGFCQDEMPDFEQFYKDNDVRCFYIMSDMVENYSNALSSYIDNYDDSVPILIDENGSLFMYCGVNSFPQTFVIGPDNEFLVYYTGAIDLDGFNRLLDYSKETYEAKGN